MNRAFAGLISGITVSFTTLLVPSPPSFAANVTGTGSTGTLGIPGGSGTAFGNLLPGDTFRINLLPYVNTILNDPNSFNAIGAAISFGSGAPAFQGVGVVASGTVKVGFDTISVSNQPIALWGSTPVPATSKDVLTFTPMGLSGLFGAYRTADFSLFPTGTPRTASVGGLLASAVQFNLSDPTRFDLIGTYVGGGDNNTKINFGLASFTNRGTTGDVSSPKAGDLDFSTAKFNGGYFTLKEDPEFIPIDPPGPGRPVPGPLPVFGALTAYGFSRKLRKRIKASTPEVVGASEV